MAVLGVQKTEIFIKILINVNNLIASLNHEPLQARYFKRE